MSEDKTLMHLIKKVVFAAVASSMAVFAQNPITADSPFQIGVATRLDVTDAVINISNSGANGNSLYGPGYGGAQGNICANVYAFSQDEQLISCCSCLVTPNGLVSLSVNGDLTSNTLTGVVPPEVVVKVLATATGGTTSSPDYTGTSCAGTAATVSSLAPATGLLAWGTSTHIVAAGYSTTETTHGATVYGYNAFTPSTLSSGELASIENRCRNIIGNGSKFGICGSCRPYGLGAKKK